MNKKIISIFLILSVNLFADNNMECNFKSIPNSDVLQCDGEKVVIKLSNLINVNKDKIKEIKTYLISPSHSHCQLKYLENGNIKILNYNVKKLIESCNSENREIKIEIIK